MKIWLKKHHLLIITCIGIQFLLIPAFANSNSSFINSFWNTLGYGDYNVLTDWSEAGKVEFSILDFAGFLYIKNDYESIYLGVRVLDEIDNLTWRINFDVDADGGWAEDAKALTLRNQIFSYDDEYYLQNNPEAFSDAQQDDFTASMRTFTSVNRENTIFELKIPLQTNDHLHDLQVQNPETTIIGISMDVELDDSGINGTWKGSSYPDYANASNYVNILFAGPQDRKIPVFEEEEEPPPEETTELEEETTSTGYGYPPGMERGAATSFEAWIVLISIAFVTILGSKKRRRDIK
ncbi:MAG: hypothetical protein JSW11_17455 [Candidatus Heimdallarchaeota archaeon]|nr:MAG: hypothetical protein JSW11_17455 [Candidatus Heimdallarchaeota archaeon]